MWFKYWSAGFNSGEKGDFKNPEMNICFIRKVLNFLQVLEYHMLTKFSGVEAETFWTLIWRGEGATFT